jgi:hypothetical protein
MRGTLPALLALVVISSAVPFGCATNGWEKVRAEDTPAAYRHFLDRSPGSAHAAEARERLDYLLARRDPTPEAVDRFREAHPQSGLLPELESLLESRSFEAARTDGSVAAYAHFLARFPHGPLAARARGNVEYLRHGGFVGRPDLLAAFAAEHPESDFAAEAARTQGLIEARASGSLHRVSLRIELQPVPTDGERLRKVFTERAQEAYGAAGVLLVPGASRGVDGVLTIRHSEHPVPTQVYEGRVEGPGVLAETQVTLERPGTQEPIWSQTFHLRVPVLERRGGGSVLFTQRARSFWSRFFVPVATWPTEEARRAAVPLRGGAVAVGAELDRAVALFSDGRFRELDLSDPAEPKVVAEYARRPDLSHFSGVRMVGSLVVLYGEDGLELVARGTTPRRLRALGRDQVGAVRAVDVADGTLWIASSRGLLRTPLAARGAVDVVAPRALQGMAIAGGRIFVLDDRKLYAAPLSDPRGENFEAIYDVGRGLDADRVRAAGGLAVVLAPRGILCIDVREGSGRLVSRFDSDEVGPVSDVAILGPRVFLVGDRGLQVVDPRSGRVLDSVDVAGRLAVDASGRHMVVVGPDRLQVVDASPWTSSTAAAAAAIAPTASR